MSTIETKKCYACKEAKSNEKFSKNKTTKDGLCGRCKVCDNAARKKYYETNLKGREKGYLKARELKLKTKYNMSLADYNKLLDKQSKSCAICNITLEKFQETDGSKNGKDGRARMFAVDHCHATNITRGLLCSECNRGIGMIGDTAESLLKAYNYLRKFEDKTKDNND